MILFSPQLHLLAVEAVGHFLMSMEQMVVQVAVVLLLVVLVELATPQHNLHLRVVMVALEHPVLIKVVVAGALPLLVVQQQPQHLVLEVLEPHPQLLVHP